VRKAWHPISVAQARICVLRAAEGALG
jgi:hypothetical protein